MHLDAVPREEGEEHPEHEVPVLRGADRAAKRPVDGRAGRARRIRLRLVFRPGAGGRLLSIGFKIELRRMATGEEEVDGEHDREEEEGEQPAGFPPAEVVQDPLHPGEEGEGA